MFIRSLVLEAAASRHMASSVIGETNYENVKDTEILKYAGICRNHEAMIKLSPVSLEYMVEPCTR